MFPGFSRPFAAGASTSDRQILAGVRLLRQGYIQAFAGDPQRDAGGDATNEADQVVPTHHPSKRHTKNHARDHANVIHAFTIAHNLSQTVGGTIRTVS